MKKNEVSHYVTVANYIARREQICVRLDAIADAASSEQNRQFTDAEKAEIENLEREMDILDVKIAGAKKGMVAVTSREASFDEFLREAIQQPKVERTLQRATSYVHQTTSVNANAMMPLTIEDVVEPLEQGLILNLVGIPTYTGLAGNYVIPTIDAVEAEVAGESVELNEKTINFGKIQPAPKRVGVTIRVTNQLINQTEGVAYNIIVNQLPKAVARTLNSRMFCANGSDTTALVGPFKDCAKATAKAISAIKTKADKAGTIHVTFAAELPTYKELLTMRGIVLAKGVKAEHMAYVMDEYTKAQLEATPRDAGSGLMVIEDGKIGGVPVFCTNFINTASAVNVGFGCFGNVLCQQFGDFRFIVDPYGANARHDEVSLTLNSDWSMDVVRGEAFVLGTCTLPA